MQIADNTAVSIHYTLTNDAGETLDSSQGQEPLSYVHGNGQIIPGLEAALAGKSAGDTLQATIPAEEAYGPRHDELIQAVPREAFEGVDEILPGMQFQAQTEQGPQLVTVAAVTEDTVTVDANHPLAGETLHFDVEVVEVSAAE
ncbi:MAG TPA: peptidylprolyl isomerase [Alcanivoracaceae bacterium]|nr:peptidylprolyl isomerase [Alcanivoracaceae bacterium]